MLLWHEIILICVWFWLSKETFSGQYWINTSIIRTQWSFHFRYRNFNAILKMLAHLSASIFTSKSNHCSLIEHEILVYNSHKYCIISFIHVRVINELNGLGCHKWCTVASPDDCCISCKGKLPYTIHATQPILLINFSNMYKRYHAILMSVVKQYLMSY